MLNERPNLCYMKGQIYVIWKAKFMFYERPNLCSMKGQIYVIWKAKSMLYGSLNQCYMLQSHKINFQSRIYSGPVI